MTLQPGSAIQFFVRLDGMNVWLLVLTAVLMVSSVLVSWTAIEERTTEFYAWLLILEAAMLGVFVAFDLVLFYVFFELTLVPLFFLIGIWGGEEKQYAARKFFIYTFGGSLITLVGLIGVILMLIQELPRPAAVAGKPAPPAPPPPRLTFAIPELVQGVQERSQYLHDRVSAAPEGNERIAAVAQEDNWRQIQKYLFIAMMVGFAIKVPLFPVHTWLPLAHVEAPDGEQRATGRRAAETGDGCSFPLPCLPLAPDAALTYGASLPWACSPWSSILYGAFCALAQDDMKKLVAYSSVHPPRLLRPGPVRPEHPRPAGACCR